MRVTFCLAALTLSALSPICLADITGKVTLNGKAPEMKVLTQVEQVPDCAKMHKEPLREETVVTDGKGDLQNVVVSIRPSAGQKVSGKAPTNQVVLDQKACQYVPHVVALMVNQPIVAKTSDSILHNVHTMPFSNNAQNFAMVVPSTHKMGPFTQAEAFAVKCDVHPWMQAFIVVLDNPYFAVTGPDGSYKISSAGLPDGEYELVFWQEKYGEKTHKVNVKNGNGQANFSFDADAKAEAPAAKSVTLISLTQKSDSDACCTPETAKTAVAATK